MVDTLGRKVDILGRRVDRTHQKLERKMDDDFEKLKKYLQNVFGVMGKNFKLFRSNAIRITTSQACDKSGWQRRTFSWRTLCLLVNATMKLHNLNG